MEKMQQCGVSYLQLHYVDWAQCSIFGGTIASVWAYPCNSSRVIMTSAAAEIWLIIQCMIRNSFDI